MDRVALTAARETEAMEPNPLGTSYLVLPDCPAPYPGVVVIHEASGPLPLTSVGYVRW